MQYLKSKSVFGPRPHTEEWGKQLKFLCISVVYDKQQCWVGQALVKADEVQRRLMAKAGTGRAKQHIATSWTVRAGPVTCVAPRVCPSLPSLNPRGLCCTALNPSASAPYLPAIYRSTRVHHLVSCALVQLRAQLVPLPLPSPCVGLEPGGVYLVEGVDGSAAALDEVAQLHALAHIPRRRQRHRALLNFQHQRRHRRTYRASTQPHLLP
eukprot:CAMPEP_0196657816 /NCGR_PEP_ID=MMETSP1086-20130531/25817_1 /TAXON_ID=77921 /ORGANISM="Cyanoptyche  gloeocystis , Strain SAG4.97" /LENGTH=209 /DNA_ID=CAMNT_0041991111 /DNA_START=39 /DNA_END=665 /DNA_ORIENTATION=+